MKVLILLFCFIAIKQTLGQFDFLNKNKDIDYRGEHYRHHRHHRHHHHHHRHRGRKEPEELAKLVEDDDGEEPDWPFNEEIDVDYVRRNNIGHLSPNMSEFCNMYDVIDITDVDRVLKNGVYNDSKHFYLIMGGLVTRSIAKVFTFADNDVNPNVYYPYLCTMKRSTIYMIPISFTNGMKIEPYFKVIKYKQDHYVAVLYKKNPMVHATLGYNLNMKGIGAIWLKKNAKLTKEELNEIYLEMQLNI